MELRTLSRDPTAYEIITGTSSPATIVVDAKGTVNMPGFAKLSATEAQEVAMCILFAAALAELEGKRLTVGKENP